MNNRYQLSLVLFPLTLAACAGSSPDPAAPDESVAAPASMPAEAPAADAAEPASPAADTSAESFDDQVAAGAQLYAANCAGCHGDSGQGTDKAPAVVGEGALPLNAPEGRQRDATFKTALDVFQWVKESMPPSNPGGVSDADYARVLAFALSANGVTLEQALGAANAASVVLNE